MMFSFVSLVALLPSLAFALDFPCAIETDFSVGITDDAELMALMQDSTIYPLSLYMGSSTGDFGEFSCYRMNSDFSLTYYVESESTYVTTPVPAHAYEDGTLKIQYDNTVENLMAVTGTFPTIHLQLYAIEEEFLIFRYCQNGFFFFAGVENYYVFAKATTQTSSYKQRCFETALDFTYDITNVSPLGVCSDL